MAVEQPAAGIVGNHVGHLHGGREQIGHIGAHAGHHHRVAVPMGGVQVDLAAHAPEVPAHPLAGRHVQAGQVAEHIPVDHA
jgi:hypothetical protein